MTVQELARELHVSRMTVYRKASDNGIALSEYRDNEGNLTEEGVRAISALFDNVTTERRVTDTDVIHANDTRGDSSVTQAAVQIASLQGRITALEAENKLLREMLEHERQNAENWRQNAERAQQAQLYLLPEKTGGFKAWVNGIFRKGDNN